MPIPSTRRPPLASWSVAAIRATTAGGRFITLRTNVMRRSRLVLPASAASVVQHSRTGSRRIPRLTKWSQIATPS